MRGLEYFKIENLYNISDNFIVLENFQDLNALIGNNGCGKTTVLEIMYYSLKLDIYNLFNYDFKSIQYILNDNNNDSSLKIEAIQNKSNESGKVLVKIEMIENKPNESKKFSIKIKDEKEEILRKDFIKNNEKFDIFDLDYLKSKNSVLNDPNNDLKIFQKMNMSSIAKLEYLKNKYLRKINIFYIPITRTYNFINMELENFTLKHIEEMIHNEARKTTIVQDGINEELKKEMLILPFKIKSKNTLLTKIESIKNFSDKDKLKLTKSYEDLGVSENNIKNFLVPFFEELNKTKKFIIANEIKTESDLIKQILKNDNSVETIFSDKLDFCLELIDKINKNEDKINLIKQKINLLERTINVFLRENNKSFKITSNGDIVIKNEIENRKIELKDVSSGEKQLITLFTIFILKKINGSQKQDSINIFLIDEPELSLHIDWQRCFCQELFNINVKKENQYILATHSPSILLGPIENIFKLGDTDYV